MDGNQQKANSEDSLMTKANRSNNATQPPGSNYDGTISDWEVLQGDGGEFQILGYLSRGEKRGKDDGSVFRTSGIKNRTVNPGDIVVTRNSRYLLGYKRRGFKARGHLYIPA